ncbi:hypothetical protein FKM82_019487 [Ascaphus truei]
MSLVFVNQQVSSEALLYILCSYLCPSTISTQKRSMHPSRHLPLPLSVSSSPFSIMGWVFSSGTKHRNAVTLQLR